MLPDCHSAQGGPLAWRYQAPNVSSATQKNSAMPETVWHEGFLANDWLSGL